MQSKLCKINKPRIYEQLHVKIIIKSCLTKHEINKYNKMKDVYFIYFLFILWELTIENNCSIVL